MPEIPAGSGPRPRGDPSLSTAVPRPDTAADLTADGGVPRQAPLSGPDGHLGAVGCQGGAHPRPAYTRGTHRWWDYRTTAPDAPVTRWAQRIPTHAGRWSGVTAEERSLFLREHPLHGPDPGPRAAVVPVDPGPWPDDTGRARMDRLEQLVSEAFDSGSTSEVIRPAARLNEAAARAVLVELALRDVRNGGHCTRPRLGDTTGGGGCPTRRRTPGWSAASRSPTEHRSRESGKGQGLARARGQAQVTRASCRRCRRPRRAGPAAGSPCESEPGPVVMWCRRRAPSAAAASTAQSCRARRRTCVLPCSPSPRSHHAATTRRTSRPRERLAPHRGHRRRPQLAPDHAHRRGHRQLQRPGRDLGLDRLHPDRPVTQRTVTGVRAHPQIGRLRWQSWHVIQGR